MQSTRSSTSDAEAAYGQRQSADAVQRVPGKQARRAGAGDRRAGQREGEPDGGDAGRFAGARRAANRGGEAGRDARGAQEAEPADDGDGSDLRRSAQSP